ncbi:MAG: Nramp family divalent metal transporter [Pirellulaceae bacterium]
MTAAEKSNLNSSDFEAPYPGTQAMPRWDAGELAEAPIFNRRNLLAMIGPGLVMGASAIGGGEWLAGPAVTAMYGGALLWVATVSIFFQVIYNIEISRYTLYTGEPIFTGKFRLPPHPMFWLVVYLLLDWGSIFPYLVTNAAVPLEAIMLQRLPEHDTIASDWWLHKWLCTGLYLMLLVPLVFGGKIYNSLKVVMTFKLVVVISFLLFLGIFFAKPESWFEIISGLFKFGNVPVPGGQVENVFIEFFQRGRFPDVDLQLIAMIAALAAIAGNGGLTNTPISNFTRDQGWGMGDKVGAIPSVVGGHGITLSHVGCVFQVNQRTLPRWRRWVRHVGRDQWIVWMGACLIGVSLPSILSVEFLPRGTDAKDWTMAALTAGGVQEHVTTPPPGVLAHYEPLRGMISGPQWGRVFWGTTLFCGFLVLITSQCTTMDGFCRRWVDVTWTAVPSLRKLQTDKVKYVYFVVLMVFTACGLAIIWATEKPGFVFKVATTGYNFALAFSSWHTLVVNTWLLPPELRPGWAKRIALILGGCFFLSLGVMSALKLAGVVN